MYHTRVNGWVIGMENDFDMGKLDNVVIVPYHDLLAVTDFENFAREGLNGKPFRYGITEVKAIVDHQTCNLCDLCDHEFDRLFNRCSFQDSSCIDRVNVDQLAFRLKQYGKADLKVKGKFVKAGYCVYPFQPTTIDNICFQESLVQERKRQIREAVQARLQYHEFKKSQCKDCFLSCQWYRWNMRDNTGCQIPEEEYKNTLLQQVNARFGSVDKFLELSGYAGMKLRLSRDDSPVRGSYVITCPVNPHAFLVTQPHYPFRRFILEKSLIKEKPKKIRIKNKNEVACMLAALQNSSCLGIDSVPLWKVYMSGRIWVISIRPDKDGITVDASQSKRYTRTTVEFGSLKEMISRLGYHYYYYAGYSGLSVEWVTRNTGVYTIQNKRRWNMKNRLLAKYQEKVDLRRLRGGLQ